MAKRSSAKQINKQGKAKGNANGKRKRQLKMMEMKIIGLQMLPGSILLIERKNRKSLNLCPDNCKGNVAAKGAEPSRDG